MNTIARHHKQIYLALEFLAKAKFTSSRNLQMVAGRDRRGFPAQLKKMGLIVSRKMAGGHLIHGLSKLGANQIGTDQFDIHKVGLSRVEHALIAQYETLFAVKNYGVTDYRFEPQAISRDTRPDAVWDIQEFRDLNNIILKPAHQLFLEVELSAKNITSGEMDRFFLKLIGRNTIVVFRDPVLHDRYLRHAREYAQRGIPHWKYLQGDWIKFDEFIKIKHEEWSDVLFQIHKSGPIGLLELLCI